MSNLLSQCITDATPATINKHIVHSIAAAHMDDIITYMTKFLSGVFKGGANNIKFISISKCGVHETIQQLRNGPANSLKYGVTVSDLVLYKIMVAFNGQPMVPKYIYLPFCREAGLIKISGSTFRLISILSDKSLSPSTNGVFARLFRYKIGIHFKNHTIRRGDSDIVTKVLISDIYRTNTNKGGKLYTKSKPGPMLYLLAHYGFTEAFTRLIGWVPEILAPDAPVPEGMVVFNTTGKMPHLTYIGVVDLYKPTPIRIVISEACDVSAVRAAIGNLFYILDHFPYITPDNWDDTNIWRVVLGKMICGVDTPAKLMSTVDKHMKSLDNYVDSFMVDKIHDEYHDTLGQDFTEDGFFKMLTVVMQRFEQWTLAADEITASTLDKRFETLYHLLYGIIKSVNSFSFDIEQKSENYSTTSNVLKHFNKKVTRGRIYSIRSNNITCSPITYSGDHMYPKITSGAELQLSIPTASSTKSSSKSRSVAAANATTTLHETQMYCSTQNAITIDRLSPVTYLNIFAPYDPVSRTFIPTQKMIDDTRPLQMILKGMTRRSTSPTVPPEFNIYAKDKI